MNIANQLTLVRIAVVPLFIAFLMVDNFYTRLMALIIFIAAGITDLYDGAIARRTKTITIFGIFFDPLADKILMSAAFISFLSIPELGVPAWMVVFIIAREFTVTNLRLLAATRGRILAADNWGKFKTSSQVTVVITIMVILLANSLLATTLRRDVVSWLEREGWRHTVGWILNDLPYWLMLISMIITILSGASYLYRNRDLLTDEIPIHRVDLFRYLVLALASGVLSYLPARYTALKPYLTGAGVLGTLEGVALALLLPKDPWNYASWLGAGFILSVLISQAAEKYLAVHDDPRIVIDEIIGYPIALLGLPLTPKVLILAFVLFRILDVTKPWLIRRAAKLPGGGDCDG